eukprot:1244504-Ditylum_brightwellii.AAC.1
MLLPSSAYVSVWHACLGRGMCWDCYRLDPCCCLGMVFQDIAEGVFIPVLEPQQILHRVLEDKVGSGEEG